MPWGSLAPEDEIVRPPVSPAAPPKALTDAAWGALVQPLIDAKNAIAGKMTDAEAQDFAMGGAMGLLPMGRGLKSVAGAAKGIRAYHGSPHDFDKFDMSKIGTGEGAQAYGHGLYFAENPKVAESYKDLVDNGRHPLDPRNFYTPAMLPSGKGKMYEVNINAHPDQFLDWDKPLSTQSADVRAAMNAVHHDVRTPRDPLGNPRPDSDPTGGQVYRTIQQQTGDRGHLIEGIPGIKYLDQGSRTAGEGTSNYVLFNDKIIDILRKYGIAGTLGGAGAAFQSDQPFGSLAPR